MPYELGLSVVKQKFGRCVAAPARQDSSGCRPKGPEGGSDHPVGGPLALTLEDPTGSWQLPGFSINMPAIFRKAYRHTLRFSFFRHGGLIGGGFI